LSAPSVIAITGFGGFFGRRLALRLLARPRPPTVVGLDLRRPWRLEGRCRFHRVDLTDPTADSRLAEVLERDRVEAVVHCAFRSRPSADLAYEHELETLGSLHLMHACAAAGVRRLVWLSSTMLYGARPDNPGFLTEAHPLRGHPDAHAVRNRIEAERLLARWHDRHPQVELTVLRPCWVMGPTCDDRVVRFFERPVVTTVMGYDPMLQLVHEDDVLDVLERAVSEAHPGIFNVVGRGVLPLSTLLALAGKRCLPVPAPLLYRLAHQAHEATCGDAPAGFYDYLRWSWVADGARGWQAFGDPCYDTREAWISFVSSRRMRRYR